MEQMKESIIRLERISLESLDFTKKAQVLQRISIPPKLLRFDVTVETLTDTTVQSRCDISVLSEQNQEDDFEIHLSYLIIASISDISQKEALEKFAKFGAPFNALVYARDLIANITSRAFGQPAMLPLLDIRQLGESINIISKASPQNPPESGTPPSVE